MLSAYKSNCNRNMEQVMIMKATPKWYEYIIVLFLILWSGGGFTYGMFPSWMLFMLPFILFIFLYKGFKLPNQSLLLILSIIVIHFLQMLRFGGSVTFLIKPIAMTVLCGLLATILAKKFTGILVNLIYYISLISLILWIICMFPPGLSILRSIAVQLPLLGWENIEGNTNIVDTLYIFSIPREIDGLLRNSGPFWEPGRFTIYITLALAMNLFYYEEKLISKRSLVLLFTNITTFSTTGYVATMVLIVVYILFSHIKVGYKFLLCLILPILAGYIFQLDFMSEKIISQANDDASFSRFGAILYHLSQIKEAPFVGFGPYLVYALGDELLTSPNGLTDLIRIYGIPLFIILFYSLYKSISLFVSRKRRSISLGVFICVLLLCFSQTITTSPFFFLLYFLAYNNSAYDR